MSRKRDSDRHVKLSVPWSAVANELPYDPKEAAILQQLAEEMDSRNTMRGLSEKLTQTFLQERTRLHETYIKEQERTKRIGMIAAMILILGAAALILFAPAGRETLSYWIGAALVIFAAGAMGYPRVWGKSKNISFGADQDQRDLPGE